VISLGATPLANALRTDDDPDVDEARYPLDVAFCPDCSLVQIDAVVAPERLFRAYVYRSSYSDTMVQHATALAERLIDERGLGPSSLVVEAASNDGYLLRTYRDAGVRVLGIEPAENVADVAEAAGIPTRTTFFTHELGHELVRDGVRADVFHAHNVLAHVPDLKGFVAGIEAVLAPNGVAVIEVPYVKDMLDGCEFDTIYHEHLSYFSLTALDRCFTRHGLTLTDVERVPIHGGSLRLFAEHAGARRGVRVEELLAAEAAWGVTTEEPYRTFADRVGLVRERLRELLGELRTEGKRIAAYGASAKGTTLLTFCGIGRETLDFVVDRSPLKQGLFTPGTRIPIHPTERLVEEMPDYTLLLTWNFADEILDQQAEYHRRGGRFIVPIPELQVV
jgi:SAM-dependent methyltransferase